MRTVKIRNMGGSVVKVWQSQHLAYDCLLEEVFPLVARLSPLLFADVIGRLVSVREFKTARCLNIVQVLPAEAAFSASTVRGQVAVLEVDLFEEAQMSVVVVLHGLPATRRTQLVHTHISFTRGGEAQLRYLLDCAVRVC